MEGESGSPTISWRNELTRLERYSRAQYTHACMLDTRLKNEISFTKETKNTNIKKLVI